jgi:hypothetical protein
VALGQVFSEYFGFPCQFSFHQLLHNHPHLSSGAGTIGQKWPQYKGLSLTPLAITKIVASDVSGHVIESEDKSYIIRLNLSFLSLPIMFCSTVSQFGLTRVTITESHRTRFCPRVSAPLPLQTCTVPAKVPQNPKRFSL